MPYRCPLATSAVSDIRTFHEHELPWLTKLRNRTSAEFGKESIYYARMEKQTKNL